MVAREIELNGLESVSFRLETPEGVGPCRAAGPGLYNVYNALAAASLARALGASLEEIVVGLEGFGAAFGRFERIQVGDRLAAHAADQEPGRCERGRAHARRRRCAALAVVALNDEIADGRDVSWIWDVDFEPLLEGLERLVATGERAAELALRFKYAGFDRSTRSRSCPRWSAALDRGLELTPAGGELAALPTYTAMLALRDLVARRGS